MASIQKTFKADFDTSESQVKKVIIGIKIPTFSYRFEQREIFRYPTGYKDFNKTHEIEEKDYLVNIHVKKLLESGTEDIYGFFLYHFIDILKSRININDYAFKFEVNTQDASGHIINTKEYEGIFYQKSPYSSDYDKRIYEEEYNDFVKTYGPNSIPTSFSHNNDRIISDTDDSSGNFEKPSINNVGLKNLPDHYNKRIFIINKEVYETFKYMFQVLNRERTINDSFVLNFIQILVDLTGQVPKLSDDKFTINYTQLQDYLRETEYNISKEFFDYLKENFNDLFDFPIHLPGIKTTKIKGTFEIESENEVSSSNWEYYDLTAEYTSSNSESTILRYNFSNQSNIDGNSADFAFNNGEPVILSNVDGPIRIRVKGYDGSIIWERDYEKDSSELEDIQITVPLRDPKTDPTTTLEGKPKTSKKIRGKVLQTGNKYDLNKLTVIIQAKKNGDELNRIVASGETDKSGNFSMDFPYGEYDEAQALVSIAPDSPVQLEINSEKGQESISDDFIYLLLSDSQLEATIDNENLNDDCDCHDKSPTTAHRLPDQQDLIDSDEYTQDIGGTCLNLTTPNRTLREYSYNAVVRISDPDVSNYILNKEVNDDKVTYNLTGTNTKLERGIVDLNNPIKWQEAPDSGQNLNLYQAVTVATGHIIHFKSVFKADGYSLGDLVYSLPLAPGQKKQIVVFESSHNLTGAESQTLSQDESLSAELISDRFITDQLSGGLNEDISGKSKAKTSGMSAGLGASASYGGIGASLGVAGGFANSSSSASQNSSRNISQFFGEKLRQSLMQNAESYRRLNSSVVTSVTQGQDYGVTAETVANHNHCHSLTMMYFEVLRHYAIYQEVSHVEECLFVPLLLTNFSTENISKWKEILAPNLLNIPSNTYLRIFKIFGRKSQHPLLKAFDANDRIKTNYKRVDFPPENETYADGDINQIKGEFTLKIHLKRPKSRYDRIKSLPVISQTISHKVIDPYTTAKKAAGDLALGFFTGGLSLLATGGPDIHYKTIEEEILVKAEVFDQFMKLDANYQIVPPARCIRIISFKPRAINYNIGGNSLSINYSGEEFFEDSIIDKKQWTAYAKILGYDDVLEFLEYYFAGRLIAEWDGIFEQDILPEVFSKLIDSIKIDEISWDLTSTSRYTGGHRRIRVRVDGECSKTRKQLPDNLIMSCGDALIKGLKSGYTTLDVENISLSYSTDHFEGKLFRGFVGNDLLDDQGVKLYIPLTTRDKINPRKEDKYLVSELIEHLNSNIEHYNKLLWANLDDDRRFMLLDGFNIQTYTASGAKAAMRSLASVVKNELITITGNSLVFPVADGYRVNRNNMLVEVGDDNFQEISLIDYYKPLTPMPPYRLSVPTRGVFMEAIQGSCDACEMVKENSSQDWDKFRTEEPTSIQPIVTPTPSITDYRPQYRDFANPLVNIQNAPDAPAPGAGLANLSELLGKAGAFNDITGLSGNQDNVIRTYLSNQENAKAFAEMSKSLATQQHNTSNSQNISEGIDQARRSGNITEEDAQNLTRQHLQQQIDGGESNRETAQFDREQNRPSLSQLASQAADRGQAVQAERTDADGTHESVNISDESPEESPRLSLLNDSSDLRAFHPSSNDKSGEITLNLNVNDLTWPNIEWSNVGSANNVEFLDEDSASTVVRAKIPGLHQIRVVASDRLSFSSRRQRKTFNISVPQFIIIAEDATEFNNALSNLHVSSLKNRIVEEMKATIDHLMSTSNIRTIWQLGPFSESVPSFISNNQVTTVTMKNMDPSRPTLTGHADPHGIGWGPTFHRERIEIYPGAYINDTGNPALEYDLETQALVLQLREASLTTPELEDFAVKVFGRLFGSTAAHEIFHSLLGPTASGHTHNNPVVAGDIMNQGGDRTFSERTGLVDNAHTSPVDPDNFTDNGITSINGLQAANQARMDSLFPLNP